MQRTESFTGIDGVNVQDRAIQETMGRIVDRSKEHLGPADKAIIQLRRLLRQAVNTAMEAGTPAGVRPTDYVARRRDLCSVCQRCAFQRLKGWRGRQLHTV